MKSKQKKLPNWCKKAQVTMIMNDIDTEMLSERTGYCPQHLNAILNGRVRSDKGVAKISSVLGISSEYD